MKKTFIKVANATSSLWLKKTVKTNINASAWLPGVKKELKVLGREVHSFLGEGGTEVFDFDLNVSEQFAQERRWSLATRLALIERGCFVLIEDISTLDELDAMLKREKVNPISEKVWLTALRRRTPTKDKLASLVSTLPMRTLAHIVEHIPTVFNDLSVERIDALELSNREQTKHWLLFQLSKSDPKRWSLPLAKILLDECDKKDHPELMSSWLKVTVYLAIKNKVDISSIIPRIYKKYNSLYDDITSACGLDENWEFARPIILNWMPQLLHLVKDITCPFDQVITHSVECNEPAILLKIAYRHVDSPEVHQVLLDNLNHIVKAEKNFVSALNNRLIFHATNERQYFQIISANKWYNFENANDDANLRLLKNKVFNSKATDVIIQYFFPFTGWDTDDAKCAIRILVGQDKFPVSMIDSLSEEMQAYAYETMRTRAQALVLNSTDMGQVKYLLSKRNLTVEAEQIMLKRVVTNDYTHFYENLVVDYIASKKLAPSSFVFLTKCNYGSLRLWKRYLTTYASKHGLTQNEFAYIMQGSTFPTEAIEFECFLKD